MQGVTLSIPGEALIGAKIPRDRMERDLRQRLAMALFSDGVISGAAACRMSQLGKAEFQYLLGEHGISQPLRAEDVDIDLGSYEAWDACRS